MSSQREQYDVSTLSDAFDAQRIVDYGVLLDSPGSEACTITTSAGATHATRAFITRLDTLGQYAAGGQASQALMTIGAPSVGFSFDETNDTVTDKDSVVWRVDKVTAPGYPLIQISCSTDARVGL
jgi:hypothetical protein